MGTKVISLNHFSVTNEEPDLDGDIMKFCKGGYNISTVGRLPAEKGYYTIVIALEQLSKEVKDAHILNIGEGTEIKSLKSYGETFMDI
jgi:hypothetical protein